MQRTTILWLLSFILLGLGGCHARGSQSREASRQVSADETFAELRTIKGSLSVQPRGERARAPFRRERLTEGERVDLPQGGLGWMRRDAGATWLVAGPGRFTLHADNVEMFSGRAFIDSELGAPVEVLTPRGKLELSGARVSLEVRENGVVTAYVLRGSARAANGTRVGAGEQLTLQPDGAARRAPVVSWEDWTGGLATADPVAEPAPFGIGTVGARKPGAQGKPRFSLVIQRLDVKVTVERDFAVTEVDETFVNPSSETVEGLFSFRTAPGAVLSRFGVDRQGDLIWGRVQEQAAAVKQYESNVYQGSEEEPALLQWAGAGVYSARLYPIRPGASRRVVTRYSEWLSREGANGERRLYVYPMAAEGARASLPRIEELRFTLELGGARATRVRAGMAGKREGSRVVVKAFDFVPRADLAVELFDAGQATPVAYRAPHRLGPEDVPESASSGFAREVASQEADYVAVPLRLPSQPVDEAEGIDIGVVVDSSAATEASALALARSMTSALLAQLGPKDRAALWAGDASLRPVAEGSGAFSSLDSARRRTWLAGLAAVERGGATDLGALLNEAASKLDPKRRGAIVYVGDGQPTVGELAPKSLRDRLSRLPPTTRLLAAAVGSQPNLALLESLVRGAPVEQVADGYGAARAALRLLEAAGRPLWLGAKVDFGAGVERVLPRELPPVASDESTLVVGRITGKLPSEIGLSGSGGAFKRRLIVTNLSDAGDLRRRWGQARLSELMAESAGRSSLVELARRYGFVSPFTALYVPTQREVESPTEQAPERPTSNVSARKLRWKPWAREQDAPAALVSASPVSAATRAKGEAAALRDERADVSSRLAAVQEAENPAPPSQPGPAEKSKIAERFAAPGGAELEPATPAAAVPEAMPLAGSLSLPVAPARAVGGARTGASARSWQPSIQRPGPTSTQAAHPASADFGGRDDKPSAPRGRLSARKAPAALADASPVEHQAAAAPSAEPPAAAGNDSRQSASVALGAIGHEPRRCSAAADLPFSERRLLWRERLVAADSTSIALDIYQRALRDCEAARWNERAALLVYIVDRLPSIAERVSLWRALLSLSPAAADAVYRSLLLRVQTATDLKELHEALGLARIDASILESLLKRARSSAERLSLLRGAAERFPDDTELALVVLDAYEDALDDAGGRAWARRLRHRADATSHVRTNVGEYYLRLAARAGSAGARDAEEARRTFGELVEFAPDDPLARRRLGDLLRAHGWYSEALRQYQTLSELTPDDPSVPLLLAAAANGVGRVEEAVRWAQKVSEAGAPDGSSQVALAARALGSAFLAWARLDALRAGRKEELERLRARAARLASSDQAGHSGVRFLLTWEHPELRPALWSNALGSPMPVADNLLLYGVAQAFVAEAPPPLLELRLDPEDAERAARLDAKATLTAIVNEGAANERMSRIELGFREGGKAVTRLGVRFEAGELRVETRASSKEAE